MRGKSAPISWWKRRADLYILPVAIPTRTPLACAARIACLTLSLTWLDFPAIVPSMSTISSLIWAVLGDDMGVGM